MNELTPAEEMLVFFDARLRVGTFTSNEAFLYALARLALADAAHHRKEAQACREETRELRRHLSGV